MEIFKVIGSFAGILALIWNICSTYYNRLGKLQVTLGWRTKPEDLSTYLTINVVNIGVDTRVIDYVSIVYLDEKEVKNTRHSTEAYVKALPGKSLKRGDKAVEEIHYQKDIHLEKILLNRPLFFRVTDTFGKSYCSTDLNNGDFALPKRIY